MEEMEQDVWHRRVLEERDRLREFMRQGPEALATEGLLAGRRIEVAQYDLDLMPDRVPPHSILLSLDPYLLEAIGVSAIRSHRSLCAEIKSILAASVGFDEPKEER